MLGKKATNRIVLVSFVCFPVYVAISDEGFANIFANAISPTPNSTNNNHMHVHYAYLKFFVCLSKIKFSQKTSGPKYFLRTTKSFFNSISKVIFLLIEKYDT